MAKSGKVINLTALYTELNNQGQSGEYDRALKTANRILQDCPNEKEAFHCKIVCFIQLGKFQDALNFIQKYPALSTTLNFEKAYSLYRMNRTDESLAVLNSIQNLDEREKELLAQVMYRQEQYDEAFSVYKDIIKNTQDDYEEERNTNLTAVMASLQMWDEQEVEDLGLGEDTYELSYNSACRCIGRKDYAEALKKLQTAEAQCREMYEEDQDTTPEEVDAELGDIKVQMGYVLQQLGRNEDAMKCYNSVVKLRPSDIALAAVASNNIITLNKDQNVFDSQKRIKMLQADGLQQKLTRLQRQALTLNQGLFYLLQNKTDLCRKALETLRKEAPGSELPALIDSALCTKEKQYAKAVAVLKAECEKSESLHVRLVLAQLHLSQGQVYPACDVLKDLGDDSYSPGVVSTLVVLYTSQEDMDMASEVLCNAVNWYQENQPGSAHLSLLMRANANFQLRRGNPQGATEMLEALHKGKPGDMKTLAQLISAYSKFDPKKAQMVSRELPMPANLSREVDVDSLEASSNLLGPKYIKRVTRAEASPASPKKKDDSELLKKKKKKRKVKLPKDLNPAVQPDAERWLPLRERSNYRGRRRRKGAKDVGKGTQGAVSAASVAELDKSAGAAPAMGSPDPSEAAASSPAAGAGPRQQRPGGAASAKAKKKKKGPKW